MSSAVSATSEASRINLGRLSVRLNGGRLRWVLVVVVVAALLARLVPVLRARGGLGGIYAYDDAVHFGAALALMHGQLPYRDFLFLQPPGIVLALSPFGALAALTGDSVAFELARLSWMALGAVNAVVVAWLLRRCGLLAVLVGGCWYAVYLPAVVSEWTTMLEGLANLWILLALGLFTRGVRARWPFGRAALLGGGLLGLSAATKIWGVLIVLLVTVGLAATRRWRAALLAALGGLLGTTLVCLPFFLAAPATMWRMVVTDQLGRPRGHHLLANRLPSLLGLPHGLHEHSLVLAAALTVLLFAVFACRVQQLRIAPILLVALTAMLLLAPSYYPHYAGVLGGPYALTVGSACGWTSTFASNRGGLTRRAMVGGFGVGWVVLLVGFAVPLAAVVPSSRALPSRSLAASLRPLPGCVVADEPVVLVRTEMFSRNLVRGCRVVVDLSGYTYDLHPDRSVRRIRDSAFQQVVLTYLRSGDAAVVSRLKPGGDLSRRTWRTITGWPVIKAAGRYTVRRPGQR